MGEGAAREELVRELQDAVEAIWCTDGFHRSEKS